MAHPYQTCVYFTLVICYRMEPMDAAPDPATIALAALAEIAGTPEDDWLEGTIADRGLRLHRLEALSRVVHSLTAALGQSLADSMEEDVAAFPGGRLIREEVGSSAWKSKESSTHLRTDLTRAVADNIALDVATGDLDPLKRNIARATMALALEAIPSFSTLNKAGRDRLGLHIGDYRDFGTKYKVTVEALDD